jgi:hypothetical protein
VNHSSHHSHGKITRRNAGESHPQNFTVQIYEDESSKPGANDEIFA